MVFGQNFVNCCSFQCPDIFVDNCAEAGMRSFNLSADLKKINPDTTTDIGSIDLAGFEKPPTKEETTRQSLDEQQLIKEA